MMLNVFKKLNPVWKPLKSFIRNNPYHSSLINFLKNSPSTQVSKLSNGLTVATEERECYNVCIGLFFDGGSRYENNFENGITHFFEHIAFKGTKTRSRTVLEEQMSCTGARFRCFTTRELVAYYAECLSQEVPLVLDILTDCLFNNNYASTEIEQQKKMVYIEMQEHDQDSNVLMDDYLHSTAFQGTPLAQTIAGPSTNLYNFQDTTISRYLARYFSPERTVLVAVGGIKHDQVVTLANTYMTRCKPSKSIDSCVYRYTGSEIRYRDDSLPVAHCIIAVEAPSFCHSDKIIMDVAASIVGGWDRSQPGGIDHGVQVAKAASSANFCDSYKSIYLTYKDTGLWGVKIMGHTLSLDDMVLTIQDEWMYLCNNVTDKEVERARRQLKTQLLYKTESAVGACHDIGRQLLYHGHRPNILEQIRVLDKVSAIDVREACTQYIYDKCPVVVAVGPVEGLPDYNRIRAGMYWLRL